MTGVCAAISARSATSTTIARLPSAPTLPRLRTVRSPMSITSPSCQSRRFAIRTCTGWGRTRSSTALSPTANRGSIAARSPTSRFASGASAAVGVTSSSSKITCAASSPENGSASGSRAPAMAMLAMPRAWVACPRSGESHVVNRSQSGPVSVTRSTTRPAGTTSSRASEPMRSQGAPRMRPPDAATSNGPSDSCPSTSRRATSPAASEKPPMSAPVQAVEVSRKTPRSRSAPPARRVAFTGWVIRATASTGSVPMPRTPESHSAGSGIRSLPGDDSLPLAAGVLSGSRSENGRLTAPAIRTVPRVQGAMSPLIRPQS